MSTNKTKILELLSAAEWDAVQLRPGSQRRLEKIRLAKEARSAMRRGLLSDAEKLARQALQA